MTARGIRTGILLEDDRAMVSIPTPQFSDLVIDGWNLSDARMADGRMEVRRWTEAEIERWRERVYRYELAGRPAALLASQFGRTIKGGLVGRVLQRFDCPVREPADRSRLISHCSVHNCDALLSICP